MANYVSQHTGTDIDTAVSQSKAFKSTIDSAPWQPYIVPISATSSWVENQGTGADAGHSAVYKITVDFTFTSNYSSTESAPIVWFMGNDGGRYYADYEFVASGTSGMVTVYSNTKILGRICILGLMDVDRTQ